MLPLWWRYVLSVLVAVALLTALVLFVNGHNTNSPPLSNPAAAVRANREATILVGQDQAPRQARLRRGESPSRAAGRAIHARLAAQVADGSLSGPLRPARCRPAGRAGPRLGYSCSIESGSVVYPFLAVVDTASRRILYCKHDPPPVPSENVPVSSRCRA